MKHLRPIVSWTVGTILVLTLLFQLLSTTRYAISNTIWMLMPIVVGIPFIAMRRWPRTGFALLLAGLIAVTLLYAGQGLPSDIRFLQIIAADIGIVVVAATQRSRVTSFFVAASLLVQLVLAAAYPFREDVLILAALITLGVVTAAMVGNSIRQRRLRDESQRTQAAAEAVTAERLRIAREIHDMVAHSIAVIAIQAGVGRRVMRTQPEEASRALDTIETTSRETLAGLRRTLGALRQGAAPMDPLPGLDDLDQLVTSAAAGGVTVEIERLGTPRAVPDEIGLSAYRIVQEAVSNVVRHAATDRCHVTVEYRDGAVAIEVTDDGRGCPDVAAGYGMVGMRERAELLEGTFTAEHRPGGGFRVAATLPTPSMAGAA